MNPSVSVALGERSGIRSLVRELQWILPWQLQRLIIRPIGRHLDPFTDWNRRHEAIFIHVPRTGGTSVAKALGVTTAHFPITRYFAFDPDFARSAFKFTFVRNPWDRLLSSFSAIRRSLELGDWPLGILWAEATVAPYATFEDFVLALDRPGVRRRVLRYPQFRPQVEWLVFPGQRPLQPDFIGRFENLEEDFATVAQRLKIETVLPHVNRSERGEYRQAYSRKMREIVEDVYERSVKAFGYRF